MHALSEGWQSPQSRLNLPGLIREWRIDRMTDRMARRPHGRAARETYGAPDAHSFAWPPVLEALQLTGDDRLLDVGCGGGVFMHHAHEQTGAHVTGVDHSREMVELSGPGAVYGKAEQLPFSDGSFTAVSSIVAFFFFPEPVRALAEMLRVLDGNRGRVAIFTTAPEAKGTPAAPYPLATRGHFYTDDELARLPQAAGFASSRVVRTDEWAQLLVAQP
jgi:ubiquinone/menaquinone biosynthesis C-methylase UbiE